MPHRVETDPEGVDFGWVMQVTFVATILVGAPAVALLSLTQPLQGWNEWALFAIRVSAPVWLVTATAVYAYARFYRDDSGSDSASASDSARE